MKPNTKAADTPRDNLAAAVARHAQAIEAHARVMAAQQHARETANDAFARLLAAEATLKEAQADDYLAGIALGETDVATSPAETAAAELKCAKADREVALRTAAALEERAKRAAAEIEYANWQLTDAVKATLQAESGDAVTSLLARARKAQAELIDLRVQLRELLRVDGVAEPLATDLKCFLRINDCLPGSPGSTELEDFDVHPAAAPWRDLLQAMRIDACVQLPV